MVSADRNYLICFIKNSGKLTLSSLTFFRCNPIRLALAVAKVDFVDARIEPGDPNDASYKKTWLMAKPILGDGIFEFPNLPYYMDNEGTKLTQSEAILKHVGRQYSLLPKTMLEHRFEMLSEEIKDLDGTFIRLSYSIGPDGVKRWIKEDLPLKMNVWGRIIGDSFTDDGHDTKISILDLKLYCFLRKLKFAQSELSITPSSHEEWVDAYMKRVEDIQEIKAYVNSPQYLHRPLNNPHAKFGEK